MSVGGPRGAPTFSIYCSFQVGSGPVYGGVVEKMVEHFRGGAAFRRHLHNLRETAMQVVHVPAEDPPAVKLDKFEALAARAAAPDEDQLPQRAVGKSRWTPESH